MKICTSCQKDLPLDAFYANAAMEDGRDGQCSRCRRRGIEMARLSNRVAKWQPGMRKSRQEYLEALEVLRAEHLAVTGRPYIPRDRSVASQLRVVTDSVALGGQQVEELAGRVALLEARVEMLTGMLRDVFKLPVPAS